MEDPPDHVSMSWLTTSDMCSSLNAVIIPFLYFNFVTFAKYSFKFFYFFMTSRKLMVV